MSGWPPPFDHPKRRSLAFLGAATLLSVAMAAVALTDRAEQLERKYDPNPFFPELAGQINTAGTLAIETKAGTFHVVLRDGAWVIPEKDSFPARTAQVRATVLALSEIERIEPKTANPEGLKALGLDDPANGGEATRVTLTDTSGKGLASLLIGKTFGPPDAAGRAMVYARKPDETQSWAARGSLVPLPALASWLDSPIVALMRERVRSTAVTPAGGPAYTLSRPAPADAFTLTPAVAGQTLNQSAAEDTAYALSNVEIEDVRAAESLDFSRGNAVTVTTFDGLSLTLRLVEWEGAAWATLSASARDPTAQSDAAALNAKAAGRAFKLPAYTAGRLETTRDALLTGPPQALSRP